VSDIDFEEIPGVPGRLPPGEYVLWQGRPGWRSIARHTLKVRWVAGWLGIFTVLRLGVDLEAGQRPVGALMALGASLACLGILAATAVAFARSTIYTVTSKRLVLRIGVAVPMSVNVPFSIIESADLRRLPDCGEIVLRLAGTDRIAWLNLWPHVAFGSFARPRPALLALANADEAAKTLHQAVSRWAEAEGRRLSTTPTPASPEGATGPVASPLGT
jgi:hypothetical protein